MVGFIVWLPPRREPNKLLHLYDLANQHFLAFADAKRVDAFLEADKLIRVAFHSDAVHQPTFLGIHFYQRHTSTFDEYFNVTDTFAPKVNTNTLDTTFFIDQYGHIDDALAFVFATATALNDSVGTGKGAGISYCNLIDAVKSYTEIIDTLRSNCPNSIIRKYTVTDSCDNVSDTITHTITLRDTIAPWLDCMCDTLPDQDAVHTTDCKFYVPNLHDTILAHYRDNWTHLTDAVPFYGQQPAPGYEITNFRDTVVMVAFGDSCQNMDTIYIPILVPELLEITSVTSTDPNCFDGNDGTINVIITGGTADYIYSYGVPEANDTISALTTTFSDIHAGSYTVTVTDAYGCTATSNVTVDQPDKVRLKPYVAKKDRCDVIEDTTKFIVAVEGGIPDYTVVAKLWSDGHDTLSLLDTVVANITDSVVIDQHAGT